MKIAYIGNFQPPHSTENEVRKALTQLGHRVTPLQENTQGIFSRVARELDAKQHDLVLWTRTGWAPPVPHTEQMHMLKAATRAKVPTVGFHLDRWFGLNREGQVDEEPFFKVDYMFTADGGHDAEYAAHGVNHIWAPPGVSAFECTPGTKEPHFTSDIAFVGSWQPGYHAEWTHRPELVAFLQETYADRCKFWPEKGRPAVRRRQLRNLYASTKVNVGDSCLSGGATRYWSDRIPETLGRGGFLLHPYVEGIEEHFTDGEHLVLWELGDWDDLKSKIDFHLEHDEGIAARERIAAAGRAHVLEHHTYTRRMEQILSVVADH